MPDLLMGLLLGKYLGICNAQPLRCQLRHGSALMTLDKVQQQYMHMPTWQGCGTTP